jgi:site-specific recombinase XerD
MNTQANASLNNVTGFHAGSVSEDIQTFLHNKKRNASTAVSYERGLKMFFMWYKNKDINILTIDDIQVKNATIIRYQTYLSEILVDGEPLYSNSTINKFMSPIFKLYEFFEKNQYIGITKATVKIDLLDVTENKHGEMNDAEAKLIREFVLVQKKGIEKAALIKLAARISFRKSSLLNLTWDDIKKHKTNDYYEVTGISKRNKKSTKAISEDLYNELLKIKEQPYYKRYDDNKIFHLSKTTIQAMFKGINDHFDFNDEKGVVFHSLRNVMTGFIEETGGSIEEMREQLDHTGYGSLKSYIHGKDLSNSPSLRIEREISDELFEELTKEELIELITSLQGGILAQLKVSGKKLIENRG